MPFLTLKRRIRRRDFPTIVLMVLLCSQAMAAEPLGQHPGFSSNRARVASEVSGQNLQRDIAAKAHIAGAVDLAHAASAQRRDDLVRSEMSTRIQTHGFFTFAAS
jgi:hypothetical protein